MPYPVNFNSALDIQLIKKVKTYPILYDHNELKYMDVNAREVVWHKIADDLQRPAAACKARWINIRDMMRKRLKERLRKPNIRVYNYKYEEELAFLKPFFKDITNCLDTQEIGDFFEHHYNDEMETPVADDDYCDDSDDVKPLVTEMSKKKKRKSSADAEKTGSSSMNESVMVDLNSADSVDVFLMTVGATLKTFTPYYLNKAKSEIFSIVQEYELQQIVNKSGEAQSTSGANE
ncbi:hypothetical protein EVAR_10868_1 [Eumeta japonica]|uniref:MADF domain-containing protein n=1 Tax=Eumeta variegata TaxID=151549 RepID=A0A4C1UST6_EUMVA|nr:hypothetical protein EVAR_10868_1 [Eumeta japonica]